MKKKALALVLVLVLVAALTVGLVACGNEGGEEEITYNLPSLKKADVKIGVLHINGEDSKNPDTGSGYSAAHHQGLMEMKKNLELQDSQIVEKWNIFDTNPQLTKETIDTLINTEHCNVIIGTSFGYQETMLAQAKKYTNVYFSHGTGYLDNPNMNNYFGRIYQARYLSGIVAGLKAAKLKAPVIGYVSAFGTNIAETCSGINAFALGAQAVNPDVVVKVNTLESWFNPELEIKYAQEFLQDPQCKIVTQHCDTVGPCDVAAKATGAFSIGYNSDMHKFVSENNDSVLTSVVWKWGAYYTTLVQSIIAGEFGTLQNYYGGIEDGLFDIVPVSSFAAENTQKYIDAAKAVMMGGQADRAKWDVFSGSKLQFVEENGNVTAKIVASALKDNKGNTIIAAGNPKVQDEVIKGSMNYFVDGVKAVEKAAK